MLRPLSFKKAPNGDPSVPARKFRIPDGVVRFAPPSPSQFMMPSRPEVDGVVAAVGEARPCSAAGTEVTNCDAAVCVAAPAAPVVVVVAGGAANGVNVDAAAEDPA